MANKCWTSEEEQYVCDHWQTMTVNEIASALRRSPAAVTGKSTKLGLCKRVKNQCPGKNHWTAEQDQYLRDHWQDQSDEDLSEAVGHSLASTHARRLKLGLRHRESSRGLDWSQEEVELMQELWGTYTIPQIAKRLNRSAHAVKVKSTRLGLGRYVNSSQYITANQAATLMRVDIHTVTDVWIPAGLRFTWKAPQGKRRFRHIRMDDLLDWLKDNQDRWDSRRVELFALGSEPDWLKEKRRADLNRPVRWSIKWTAEEDSRLVAMFRRGDKTYAEIGQELGRSADAVERRVARLDVWGTGKYIGQDPWAARREKKAASERKLLGLRLCNALLACRNSREWGEYWQKDNCRHWDNVRGCLMKCSDCDSCSEFQRIQPQYCRRCGGEFIDRRRQDFCQRCRTARKKQAQKKYAVLRARGQQ